MSTPLTYAIGGLRLRSEVPLAVPTIDGPYDFDVTWGCRRSVSSALPEGELLARLSLPDGGGYA